MERPSTPSGFNQIVLLTASIRRNLGVHPCTVLLLGLCFFLPALLLGTSSLKAPALNRRGTAELFAITRRARLVQSFEADPSTPVPKLWKQRLGASAALDRWARHGRRHWWLIWLDDGVPLLALPPAANRSSLDLLFADDLHRSSYDQQTPLEKRTPSALEQACLQRLIRGTAVQWQPAGLAAISGPLFPALASASHGCLSLVLQGKYLMAEGPVGPSPFASFQDAKPRGYSNRPGFDPTQAYLELNSIALQPLLGSFLNNPLIAEQLASRYGVPEPLRDVLLTAPVLLRVDALETGRFQASVQARLMVPAEHTANVEKSLDAVATALLRRGFQQEQRPLQMQDRASSNRIAEVWLDSNGQPSGGWSLGAKKHGHSELLLALGAPPTPGSHRFRRMGDQRLRLRGRPDDLVQLGWLGPGWPRVIRNAVQLELEMTALPMQQQPGWLSLQLELR